MKKDKKQQVVQDLKNRLSSLNAAVLVDYRGLDCDQMSRLRKDLRNSSAELKVVKNTLLKLASKGTSFEKLTEYYKGPTAITFIEGEPVEPAKVLSKYAKDIKSLKIKAGILQDQLIDADGVDALSKLPSKEVLLSQFLSVLEAPMRNFASVLAAFPRGFVTVLSAVKDQKEEQQ